MAELEVATSSVTCSRCGKKFAKRKGFFPVSHAPQYRGVGYLPICFNCLDAMYERYYEECDNKAMAVRQVCRALNLYWTEGAYNHVNERSTPQELMRHYVTRLNSTIYASKSYDDTLRECDALWKFPQSKFKNLGGELTASEEEEIPKEVIDFWGNGYSAEMYKELEQRRTYWMSHYPDDVQIDVGTEAIIRQICFLELDINRDRIAGKSVVNSVNALNTLLGSANLKPVQKGDAEGMSDDGTPFGVWIQKWENQRPVPEPDPDFKDVDGIIKYISVWFLGHLGKMLGKESKNTKLYDEEMKKFSVERPDCVGEDDEETLYNALSDSGDSDEDGEQN